MINRKTTAWKKNRQLGDIAGGRRRVKLEDNILRRDHSFTVPPPQEEIPILMEDNPSRNFFFPITALEARNYLHTFPPEDVAGITHLWLKRLKAKEYEMPERPLAEYIWGSGVCLIVLYPWAKTGLLQIGSRRPSAGVLRQYKKWTTDLIEKDGVWCLRWTKEAVRDFYFTGLLAHEIGHHCDHKRFGRANNKQREETADQYALRWMPSGQRLYSIEEPNEINTSQKKGNNNA